MCRNIKTLFNFDPPVTDEEVRAASLQFVRKISGYRKPSKVNEAAFEQAVEEIVTKSLKKEGKIPLGGLGAVKLVDRKARMGRNPATGEQIKIPARTAIKITPAKALKDVFNKKAKK